MRRGTCVRLLVTVMTGVVTDSKRVFSSFSEGSDEFQWKQRYLQERRDTAIEFLSDLKKRVPIHDAIRQRAIINRSATKEVHCAKVFEDISSIGDIPADLDDSRSVVDELLDDLLMDENAADRLQHVDLGDVPLLENELLGDDAAGEGTIRRWLKLKRDTADYQSYASIPEGERSSWSAWYLRHVKCKDAN
ncbi:hypothetical protein, conserved [Leishmania donovani]|uniref:Uncharacterized protein n=1 Tax=Leishmania donovani TaxID=5661 RepID=E9BV18_LEIDO|nr:hypothetical protein, conserved [Leishmania donovani]AYU84024.1 hypothetical protein LdCL_360074000 [Leishmania donovani]CBZ39097.1 hypothetical protein, conserved [Leishmania donovani]